MVAPTAPQQPAEQGTGAATGTAKEHRRVPLRYVELEKELESCRDRLLHCNGVHGEVIDIHEQINRMQMQIAEERLPQLTKEMRLK